MIDPQEFQDSEPDILANSASAIIERIEENSDQCAVALRSLCLRKKSLTVEVCLLSLMPYSSYAWNALLFIICPNSSFHCEKEQGAGSFCCLVAVSEYFCNARTLIISAISLFVQKHVNCTVIMILPVHMLVRHVLSLTVAFPIRQVLLWCKLCLQSDMFCRRHA